MSDVVLAKAVEDRLFQEVQALRSEVTLLRDDVALMRAELGALAVHAEPDSDARETVRRLWAEGLASGIAGDVDDVMDGVLRSLPRTTSGP